MRRRPGGCGGGALPGPDVTLMDIRMPKLDGIAATAQLRGLPDPAPILVLTTFGEDEMLWGAIEAGAAGFVLKDSSAEDLIGGTGRCRRRRLVRSAVAPRVLDRYRRVVAPAARDAGRLDLLTNREHAVLRLIARGATNAEIASSLHIAEATVKTHVSQIFSKLDVRDRAAAIVFAYDHGVISQARPVAARPLAALRPREEANRSRGPMWNRRVRSGSPPMPQAPMLKDEDATLAAARSGDADAFEQRSRSTGPAFARTPIACSARPTTPRMRSSVVACLAGIPRFEGRSSVRLASPDRDQCLPRSDRSPARRAAGGVTEVPLTDDHRPEPDLEDQFTPQARYEQREAAELAFIAALLPSLAAARAALILRDVLGFTARDAAEVLDSSPAAVNSALQRARAAIEERNPEPSVQSTGQALESPSSPTQSSTSSRQWNGTISRRSSTACAPPRVDESLGPSGSTNSRTNRKETRMSAEPLNLRIVQFTPREIGLHERAPTDERTREVARWSLRPRVD